jgi:hypothetical protein
MVQTGLSNSCCHQNLSYVKYSDVRLQGDILLEGLIV